MKRTLPALLLLICSVPLVAETYQTRSGKYSVEIRTTAAGENVRYDVTVTDLFTQEVMVFAPIESPREERVETMSGDLRVVIAPYAQSLALDLTSPKGKLHAVWNSHPAMVRVSVEDVERVGGDVRPPIVLTRVNPVYPEMARAERVAGVVIIEALVDKSGFVKDALILKDLPYGMGLAALDAVKQWRFAPATRNGEPVDVLFNLTINFRPG